MGSGGGAVVECLVKTVGGGLKVGIWGVKGLRLLRSVDCLYSPSCREGVFSETPCPFPPSRPGFFSSPGRASLWPPKETLGRCTPRSTPYAHLSSPPWPARLLRRSTGTHPDRVLYPAPRN